MTDTEPEIAATAARGRPVAAPRPLRRVGYRMLGHRAGLIAAVFLGGAAGTAGREAISLAYPPAGGVPYATAAINIVGALILGLLTGALTGRARRRHQGLRLLFGTGVCGGFTTYSTFATQTSALIADGAAGGALGYALGTLALGAAAAWVGLAIGTAGRGRGDSRRAAR